MFLRVTEERGAEIGVRDHPTGPRAGQQGVWLKDRVVRGQTDQGRHLWIKEKCFKTALQTWADILYGKGQIACTAEFLGSSQIIV